MKKSTSTLRQTTPIQPRPTPYPGTGRPRLDHVGRIHRSGTDTDPLTNTQVSSSRLPSQAPMHGSIVPLQSAQPPVEDLQMVQFSGPQLPTEPLPLLHPPSSQNSVMGLPATPWNGTIKNSGQPLPIQAGSLPVDKGKAKEVSFPVSTPLRDEDFDMVGSTPPNASTLHPPTTSFSPGSAPITSQGLVATDTSPTVPKDVSMGHSATPANPSTVQPPFSPVTPQRAVNTPSNSIEYVSPELSNAIEKSVEKSVTSVFYTLLPQFVSRNTPHSSNSAGASQSRPMDVNMHGADDSTELPRMKQAKRKKPCNCSQGMDDDGSDADDEEDVESSRTKAAPRKTHGKRGAVINLYHSLIREHLRQKRVLGPHDKVLPSPEASEVEEYVNDNQGGPSLEVPRFNWTENFESTWNQQLLFILATDLRPRLQESAIGDQLEAKCLSIAALKKTIVVKLKRTREDYNIQTPPPMDSQETAGEKLARFSKKKETISKKNRRNGRRNGTYHRRLDIIEDRMSENVTFWRNVETLLQELGEAGMSSDETDSERRAQKGKVLRRVPKVWLNPEISALWNAVENYGKGIYDKPGNAPLIRHFEPRPVPSESASGKPKRRPVIRCVSGLPSNYYCNLWWKTQSSAQQEMVDRDLPKDLPSFEHLLM